MQNIECKYPISLLDPLCFNSLETFDMRARSPHPTDLLTDGKCNLQFFTVVTCFLLHGHYNRPFMIHFSFRQTLNALRIYCVTLIIYVLNFIELSHLVYQITFEML